jgi:hypothetical protein
MDALQNNRIRHTLGALAGALSVVCSGGPQSALNASGASGSSASVRAIGRRRFDNLRNPEQLDQYPRIWFFDLLERLAGATSGRSRRLR